ncbi:hypothetical protein BT93_E1898 [Corymbia citriodora subsp. variegata]|nr:hypothetical protein BT93_E1898 [Corymbia citriodora subsp. variegata]
MKTYEMVDDPSTDPVVLWSQTSKSFVVLNPPEFAQDLLPRYFKHNNFSSFIRQLNPYGFRKIDPERWEFANEDFVRGLKSDKDSLQSELQMLEEERKGFELWMQNLKARFLKMEERQKNMASNLGNVLQKPGLALNLLIESEFNDKKRRLPRIGYFHDEGHGEDNHAGSPQTLTRENIDGASYLSSILDLYDRLESSLTIWEYILHDCENSSQRRSNLDFDETNSCADSPAISCIQFNIDARPRSPTIDMNSEPKTATVFEPAMATTSEPASTVASEPVSSKGQVTATAPHVLAGVNDVFWEQFLMENPGSSDTREVQSKRKDTDGRRNESKPADHGRFWWSTKNVNNLAEQLGHLTPAEST